MNSDGMHALVPDNSAVDMEEETEYLFDPSTNRVLSERQFRRAWMSVGKTTWQLDKKVSRAWLVPR